MELRTNEWRCLASESRSFQLPFSLGFCYLTGPTPGMVSWNIHRGRARARLLAISPSWVQSLRPRLSAMMAELLVGRDEGRVGSLPRDLSAPTRPAPTVKALGPGLSAPKSKIYCSHTQLRPSGPLSRMLRPQG